MIFSSVVVLWCNVLVKHGTIALMIAIALSAFQVATLNEPRLRLTVLTLPELSVPFASLIVAFLLFGVNTTAIIHTPLTFRNFVYHVDVQILSHDALFVLMVVVLLFLTLCCVVVLCLL